MSSTWQRGHYLLYSICRRLPPSWYKDGHCHYRHGLEGPEKERNISWQRRCKIMSISPDSGGTQLLCLSFPQGPSDNLGTYSGVTYMSEEFLPESGPPQNNHTGKSLPTHY